MDEYEIIYSQLSRKFKDGNLILHIDIYAGDDCKWILEITDPYNNSVVWDEQFLTDREALDEAITSIMENGTESFIGPEKGHIH